MFDTNALEIENLTKKFSGFYLNDISFTLPSGSIMGLLGENGAGKTTTIKLILDIIHKDSGSVKIFGTENTKDIMFTKHDVGVVMDDMGFPDCLSVKQIKGIMDRTYEYWDRAKFAYYVKRLSLPENRRYGELSRGMKTKLGIAVAMSHNARLLVLDEPTAGLDPLVRDEVVGMLNDFTRDENNSVLISSHIISDLEKICDYITFLHKGSLMMCEEKDELLSRYGIIHCDIALLSELSEDAVLQKSENQYGAQAIVIREKIPNDIHISPINLEDLFLVLAREGD